MKDANELTCNRRDFLGTASASAAGVGSLVARDQPVGKPFVQAPDTVSAEARKYLESLPDPSMMPQYPQPDDTAAWKRAWEAAEAATEPKVKLVLKRYEPAVKERKLGGVPVLEITPKG